jgi:vacuolar protein 8
MARLTASLTANPENQVGIFGAEEVRSLLRLSETEDENSARDACISIGNLAVIAKNQDMLVQLGALPPLIRLLDSPYVSVQSFTSRALYRLAARTANQAAIVDAGGLRGLIALMKSPDAEVVRFAVMTVCNISTNPDNQPKLVKMDAIRPLLELLDHGSEAAQKYSAMALCNVSTSGVNQVRVTHASMPEFSIILLPPGRLAWKYGADTQFSHVLLRAPRCTS